ncbi:DNA primase [Candidatus Woesearchaeota archaeon]|nr:DNA primase [Candidatus Woesearchaeota archaeon]
MGKISPVSSKYIVHASIEIDGVVDKPDVIGAIFGQTEGLLGAELELRELQRSGRIGRIEVNIDTRTGKSKGTIVIPSSLDKAETSIIAAALEIIQRIGPCNAKLLIQNIEDVRVSKRSFVIERAKVLLRNMIESTPDSQELADEVAHSVRVMEIQEYGKDRLPSGPAINESDDVIVVEGRADVVNLLKHGFKNAVAMNGTSVPETMIELCQKKVVTLFVDGDRGGDLIIKELTGVADVDFVTRAPAGKEVEEITKKEIHKALRSRISGEQAKLELSKESDRINEVGLKQRQGFRPFRGPQRPPMQQQPPPRFQPRKVEMQGEERKVFKEMIESLIGTRAAQVLDNHLNILGRVPISELPSTLGNLGQDVYAIVFDGNADRDMVRAAEKAKVKYLVAMDSEIRPNETSVNVITVNGL